MSYLSYPSDLMPAKTRTHQSTVPLQEVTEATERDRIHDLLRSSGRRADRLFQEPDS